MDIGGTYSNLPSWLYHSRLFRTSLAPGALGSNAAAAGPTIASEILSRGSRFASMDNARPFAHLSFSARDSYRASAATASPDLASDTATTESDASKESGTIAAKPASKEHHGSRSFDRPSHHAVVTHAPTMSDAPPDESDPSDGDDAPEDSGDASGDAEPSDVGSSDDLGDPGDFGETGDSGETTDPADSIDDPGEPPLADSGDDGGGDAIEPAGSGTSDDGTPEIGDGGPAPRDETSQDPPIEDSGSAPPDASPESPSEGELVGDSGGEVEPDGSGTPTPEPDPNGDPTAGSGDGDAEPEHIDVMG
jgi:hypothetical protein